MTMTIMRKIFKKLKPKLQIIGLTSTFQIKLIEKIYYMNSQRRFSNNNDDGLQRFCDISFNVLNRHAPRKRKLPRGNQISFITKDLSKAMMRRSTLRNNFLKNRTGENKTLHTKQRNYCVSFLRKSEKKYFANLNEKHILDNKLFWKTIEPLLCEKVMTRGRIN